MKEKLHFYKLVTNKPLDPYKIIDYYMFLYKNHKTSIDVF